MSVGGYGDGQPIAYAFEAIPPYYSQLEHLQVQMNFNHGVNVGFNNFLGLINLKHLELCIYARATQSMLGWIPLIEASPVLQKLTFKLRPEGYGRERMAKCDGRPLKGLKTLEIIGFIGGNIDLELVTHVIEHGVVLQEVIVDVQPWVDREKSPDSYTRKCAMNLKDMLPQGVNLIIK